MRKVSKIFFNWFLIAVFIGGFLEVSGKGVEIKPIKFKTKDVGALSVAPGITPAGPVTFCKGGYLVVTGANNNSTFQWQVGGNNISNSTNDSLFVTNTGTYTCIVTNGGNSTTLDNVVVTVESISISATSTSICNGSSTTLTASGTTTGTYTWITPPATSGAAITVSPTSNTTYSVWSDINSCRDTASITITVKPKPIASFTYSPNSGCPRKKRKLYFNSTSQQNGAGNLSYSWNFGDPNSNNNTSNDNDPDHSFIGSGFGSSGTYTVTLTVTGNNGCSNTTSQVISIGSFPDASLYDAYNSPEFSICDSNLITVVNSSSTIAINTSYQILWGDGQSTIVNSMDSLTHSYLTTGNQNLTFIVSSNGCKDSSEYSVYIGSNPGIGLSTSGSTTLLCLPSTKTFFIDTTRTLNNPLGTVYTVVYNDGSPNQVFSHPPPATFNHTFTTTSCGASGGTFFNTFFVEIYASNPCGTTKATVEPITTVMPPVANFLVSPDTIICVNSNVSFTNNTQSGNVVVQTGTGPSASFACDPSSSPFWSFSALTGVPSSWTTTGSLGVLPNNPGAQTVSATFSQTGTYLVKLQVRNNANSSASCRSDDTIKVICVQSPPNPYFKTSQKTGCRNLSINFTDSSYNLPTCGVVTRLWTVTKISNICIADSLIDFRYIGGTNSISLNPQMIFYNQGDYQIKLTLTNKCGSFSFYDTIKVKRKPEVSINLSNNITCVNQSITPSNSSTCFIDANTTYAWTFANGNPSTSSVSSPGSITYANSGSFNIGLNVTNVCGTTPASATVTVNPLPTVTGTLSVCVGQTTTLTGTSTATGSGTWTSDNTGVATVSSSGVVTGVSAGSANITFTDANGCQKGVTVTVNPLPTITGNSATCVGSTLTLTGSATAATSNPWVSATTSVATVTNSGVVTAVSSGTSVITYTNSNGCKSDVTFTANPLPTITGDTIICLNNTSQLTGSATAATTNPWVSATTSVATVSTGGLVSTVSVGTSIITYTNTNGCVKKVNVIVKPLPVITGSSSICVGSNVSFSATTNPATSTPWSSSNTGVATVSNTGSVVGVAAGTSTITYTNEFGCQATFSVTVSSSPTATISYPSTICTNQTNQSVTLTGATGGTFSISPVGTTGLSLNTSNGSVNPSTSTAGTYTVNYNIPAGNGCPAVNIDTNITITTTPSAPVPSGNNICSGNTLQLNTSYTGSGTPTWNWTGPNGFSSSDEDPSISNVTVAATGTYNLTVTISGCISPAGTVNIVVNQTPATPTASSNTPVCTGNALTLNASTTSTMPVTWSWSGPNSFTSTSQNPQVSANATTAMDGTYEVYVTATYNATSLSCSSATASTIVVVNATPVISSSSSTNPSNCASSTGSITLNGLNASTSYTVHYTNSAGAQTSTLTSSSTGVITISSLPAGTYSNVYVVLTNCPSAPVGPFSLVDPTPPVTPVIQSVNPLCSGNTINLSASTTSTGTATWSWTGPNSFTSSDQNPTITNATTLATGSYSVTVTINSCTSPAGTINVTVNQTPATPTASSNTPVCTGNALTLTASTTSTMPVTWSWSGPNSFTSTSQNPQVSANATTAMDGTYEVYATATYTTSTTLNCPSATASTIVVINPTPVISSSSSINPSSCASSTGSITLNGLNATTSYTVHYTNSAGAQTSTITSNSTGVITIPLLPAGTYSNVYVVLTNCPSAPVGPFNLVDPTPPPVPTATNNGAICDGELLQLNATTTSTGNATWNWTGPNGFTSTNYNPSINAAGLNANGVYSVTVTISNCTSQAGTTTVIVNPRPLAPVAPSPVVYCQFDVPVALTATALPGHTLNWYTSLTGGTASATAPTPSTSTTSPISYFVSQTTPANCEGLRTQIDVIVNPTPVVSGQSQTICSGASFSISPSGTSGVPSNTLYSWGLPVVTGGLTGGAAGTNQSNITGTLFNPTDFVQTATYTVSSISGNCPGNTFTVVISVNPAPRIVFSLPNQSICSGEISQAVTLTSPTPNAVIPWTSVQPLGISGVTLSGSSTIPTQTLINTTPNPITVTYTATASTTGTSSCPGTPTPYQIVVTPTPVIPNTTETICSGGFFNVQPVNNTNTIVPSGTTYTWTVSNNSNITGQSNQSIPQTSIADTLTNISNVPQTIVYTVKPRSGIADSCIGQQFTITVTVNPKPVIPTLTQTVCSGTGFLLNPANGQPNANTIVPNATVYNWSAPTLPVGMSGAASGTNQSTISGTLFNTTFAPITITYVVTPISGAAGSCPGLPFNVEITVNPLASISNNPLSQPVCNGNTTLPVNWSSFTAGSTYSWTLVSFGNVTGYLPAGNGPTLGAMTLSNNGIAQDSVVYAVSSTASACAGPATNYTIYVNPDANADFRWPYDTACWPYSIVINNTSQLSPGNVNIPNSSYNWYSINQLGTETFIGTGSVFPGYIIPGPSDSIKIKMVSISAFGCKNDSLTHTFFTKPKPTAAFTMSNRDSCGPLTISFVNQTNIRDTFRYQWNFGNGQTSTATNPGPVTYVSNPRFFDTTHYITLRAFNECDTTTYLDSVIVRADPKARFSVSSSSGCSPFTIQVTNSSLGNPHTYYWDFGDGTPIQTTTTLGTLTHTYYTGIVDTFELKLVAISACGRDSQIIKIRVAPNVIHPGVSVNATELYGCVSHSVNFINTSTGATNFTWNFGDGTPLQTSNFFQTIVNHTYNTAGNFNIQINMTNGCSDTSINTSITVYPRPTAAFTTSQTVYCFGDTTRFINNSTNATNYIWSFGNGVINTNFQPNYMYLSPGVYNVQLEAQQSNATGLVCFDTITRSITILSKPDTAIITNINPVNCSPFIITGSVPGYTTESITWYVYDTTLPVYPVVISNPILNYTFNNSGRFKVVMVIENASGCKDSSFRFLSVYAKPVAAFTPLNLTTCSLDTLVSYINNTTANIYTPLTYRWYVDGIQRATSGNFTYRYTALPTDILPRIFNTKLVATNSVGCADSTTGALQISPTAKSIFTLSNPQACIPFVAAINNSSTYATNYQWYLNGVLVSTNENPNINITTANTSYTVTLIVSNIYACRPDTSSFTFRSRVMPIAAFSFNNTLGCTGQLAVVTTNTSQHANAYTWEWGDASANSTLFNPTHIFSTVGSFNTTLTATDGVCTDTVSHSVVVSQKPTANFIANNVKNCDTSGVRFINLTANATSFLWTVSNGYTTTETSPTIILNPSPTPYSVTLLAINADGCRDSLTRANYIKVYALPQGDFTITPSPTIYIPNYTFGFLNLTPDYPIYKYNWSLGDGSFAITRDVVSHLYSDTGNYEVRLTVLDTTTSCVDTVIKYARIIGYPGYLYVPNAFYANSTQIDFKYFKPLGKGLAEYELLIFDSWGKLLFRTTKLDYAGSPVEGWDGTFKGAPMPQDAYAWKIKARFRNGKVWEGMNYDKSQQGQPAHSFGTLTLFR